ncbi:tyrosyl-DNA phosphodiesterase 2 isoform X1 [Dermochelys coriacea]|uniref:tyrosyl-DNA phosphodiesterase 2 isoform X1 n=1 Tax=Dermochelys coriacea TaxID=27794 RepID=UPI001CA9EE2B|nr:tyrosyl-DNA phosphodiesterase 2 isoform X1 [Dermochelys coriacea]
MEGGSAAEGLLEPRPQEATGPQEEAQALPRPREEEEEEEALPRPRPREEEAEAAELEALPLVKRRKLLCAEFASITSSDLALASCYLADSDWHMQRALNSYFEPPVDQRDVGGRPQARAPPETCIDLTAEVTTSSVGVNNADCRQQEDDSRFSLLTWNIDGLDLGNQQDRARGVCSYLALYSPDVVFLQEVIPPYFSYLQKRTVSYTIIPGNIDGYFTAIMLKTSRVKFLRQEIIPFPTTSMMRNLLVVHVNISGNELCLMTSHLESTKGHAKERLNQLRQVLKTMQEASESTTVVFGGDTNLRDHEVTQVGGLPNNILDIWEFLGKPGHCRYTWDTNCNSNLDASYKCKFRFDRIFFRTAAEGGQIIPRSLDLIGLEKLDCGRFPSDHWGLLCDFDVIL